MNKKTLLGVITALLLLVAMGLAFSGVCISTTIYDGNTETILLGIGFHVLVTVALFVASAVCLLLFLRALNNGSTTLFQVGFCGCYGLIGVFFALGSGYFGRSTLLLDYWHHVKSGEEWFYEEVLNSDWFNTLPKVSSGYADIGLMWYRITAFAVIATAIFAVIAFRGKKNHEEKLNVTKKAGCG